MSDTETRQIVRLIGVPFVGGQAVVMFRNDMIRELQLIELGKSIEGVGPSGLDAVAAVLRADLEWLRDEFSGHFRPADPSAALFALSEPGAVVDYIAELHPDAALRIKRVVDRVDELNWFSAHGQLLTIAASPIVMALVRWLRDEAYGQLVEGRAGRAFTGI